MNVYSAETLWHATKAFNLKLLMTHPHEHSPTHPHEANHKHGAHSHGEHSHAPANFNRAFAIGIGLNLAFVGIEAFYGWRVNSLALLADAAHNLSDVAGLVLAWVGTLALKWQPNTRHTYGWKRASILAAFANAVLLLLAMGGLAWEAIGRLMSEQVSLQAQGVTIMVVAGIGIVINTATALLFMRGREHDLNIRGAFLHMAADALVSAGVVVAGALTLWRGWVWLDPVVSLVIAAVILWGTWGLFKQSLHLLFDGVPEGVDMVQVRKLLLGLPGVADVHDLHVWAMGTSDIALTAHLVTQPEGADTSALLHEAEHTLHAHFEIRHVTLQLESPAYAQQCSLRPGHSCQKE
ncbi:MAG: cation efflux system protein CDF family [Comamonadaceae bacterium]|nr:MAG: cation efflux system protein CDF family [Comamonadaceae bacterium]